MASTKIKTLVCFYSLDGNTRHIAKAIQQKVDADLLELRIKSPYKYKGFFKIFCRRHAGHFSQPTSPSSSGKRSSGLPPDLFWNSSMGRELCAGISDSFYYY
jgi:hypothetical protein